MFEYREYIIGEIADRVEEEIYNATRPIPKDRFKYRIFLKTISPYYGANYDEFNNSEYKTRSEAMKVVKKYAKIKEKDKNGKWHYYRTYTVHNFEGEHEEREEFVIIDDENGYYPKYSKSTINEMKKCLRKLREAHICANNMGRLLRCDCGEETFKQSMKDDMKELDESPLIDFKKFEEYEQGED